MKLKWSTFLAPLAVLAIGYGGYRAGYSAASKEHAGASSRRSESFRSLPPLPKHADSKSPAERNADAKPSRESAFQDEFDAIRQVRNPIQRENALAAFFTKWGAADPRAALAAVDQFPPALRKNFIDAILKGWARSNPNDAWQWASTSAKSLPTDKEPGAAALSQQQVVLNALVEVNRPGDAALLVTSLPDGMNRSSLARQLASEWIELDQAGAIAWQDSLTGILRVNTLQGILSTLAEEDLSAATNYVQSISNPNDRSIGYVAVLLPLLQKQDTQAVLAWFKNAPQSADYDMARLTAVEGLSTSNPDEKLGILDGIQNPQRKLSAARDVVRSTALTDPGRAVQLASKYYPSDQFESAAPRLITTWAKANFQVAYDFATTSPVLSESVRKNIIQGLEARRNSK